jgi:fluoride exporter
MIAAAPERQHVADEAVEHVSRRLTRLRRRPPAAEQLVELVPRRTAERRRGLVRDEVDEKVDGPVPEFAHLLRVEREDVALVSVLCHRAIVAVVPIAVNVGSVRSPRAFPSGDRSQPRVSIQLAVVGGGVVGALARTALERELPADAHGWPWATFAVNVVGTLLLGYLVTRLQERLPPSTFPRPFLATGVCGALTTFSTLQIELVQFARHGRWPIALAYLAASLAAGLVGVYLATAAVRRVRLA